MCFHFSLTVFFLFLIIFRSKKSDLRRNHVFKGFNGSELHVLSCFDVNGLFSSHMVGAFEQSYCL